MDPRLVKLPESEESSELSDLESASEKADEISDSETSENDEVDSDEELVRKSLVKSARKQKRRSVELQTGLDLDSDDGDYTTPKRKGRKIKVEDKDTLSDRSNVDEGIVKNPSLRSRKQIQEMEVVNEEGQAQTASQESQPPLRESRRARTTINYALPKLNSKMRQEEGFVSSIKSTSALKARKSAKSATTETKSRPSSPSSVASSTKLKNPSSSSRPSSPTGKLKRSTGPVSRPSSVAANLDEEDDAPTIRIRPTSPPLGQAGTNVIKIESVMASQSQKANITKPSVKKSSKDSDAATIKSRPKSVIMSNETLERRKKGMEWVKELVGGVTLDDFETDDENAVPSEWSSKTKERRYSTSL
ncbi:hypothetical protein BT69DRAFT_297376 [Atractiella rhizophila]|nr:hypothetical protein BT69DRAFT_297376 [Atractiella rhizophila]